MREGRAASSGFLVLIWLSAFLLVWWFHNGAGRALAGVDEATEGAVSTTLLFNASSVMVFTIAMRVVGLTWSDCGLKASGVRDAALLFLGTWALTQAIAALYALTQGPLTLDPRWRTLPSTLGELLGQLFGNALVEELVYRGLLFGQLRHLLRTKVPRASFVMAVALSQTAFALVHLPGAMAQHVPWEEAPAWFAIAFTLGALFCALYEWSGNLWLCVAFHALFNWSIPFAAGSPAVWQATVAALLVLVTWVSLARRRSRVSRERRL